MTFRARIDKGGRVVDVWETKQSFVGYLSTIDHTSTTGSLFGVDVRQMVRTRWIALVTTDFVVPEYLVFGLIASKELKEWPSKPTTNVLAKFVDATSFP